MSSKGGSILSSSVVTVNFQLHFKKCLDYYVVEIDIDLCYFKSLSELCIHFK